MSDTVRYQAPSALALKGGERDGPFRFGLSFGRQPLRADITSDGGGSEPCSVGGRLT